MEAPPPISDPSPTTTPAEILENVYRKPFPNRYLASFTKFLADNIANPKLESIVIEGFNEFTLQARI